MTVHLAARHLLGRRTRLFREAKGLSQEAFGELCGLHRTYIGAIERGERNVTIDNIEKIASALGITIHELTDFATSRPPGKTNAGRSMPSTRRGD